MAFRHLSRSVVLQSLFEWDFNGKGNETSIIDSLLEKNANEFAPGVSDKIFMQNLVRGVVGKNEEIDAIISKAAPDWPVEKISIVDRNVLRIGLFELLFSARNEVPAKVAINEAIELAKTFGGESSGKFVNGVLGAVYKELGEPGKDEEAPKKKKDVPFEQMAIEKKVGGVVYAVVDGAPHMAFVHDVFGHWTLSKGGLEADENENDGLVRVIKEEMTLDVVVQDQLGDNEYVANHPEKGKHRKQVLYYLVKSDYVEPKLGKSGGLDDVRWFSLEETLELNFYNDIMPIITKAVNIIAEKIKNKE